MDRCSGQLFIVEPGCEIDPPLNQCIRAIACLVLSEQRKV